MQQTDICVTNTFITNKKITPKLYKKIKNKHKQRNKIDADVGRW